MDRKERICGLSEFSKNNAGLLYLPLRRHLHSKLLQHIFDIHPDPLLLPRTPEKIGRMESRHNGDALVLLPDAAQLRDALLCIEQILRRHVPERNDDSGMDGPYLLLHETDAGLDLVGFGIAIVRGPALDDIADIDLGPLDVHALFDDVGKELSRRADKGPSLLVFLEARSFADEHDHCFRFPFAEYYIRPAFVKFASRTISDLFANGRQGHGLSCDVSPSPLILPLEGGGRQGGGGPGFTRCNGRWCGFRCG